MKLHILSDIHLEFSAFEPSETDADVVVLAGDVAKGDIGPGWARDAFPGKEIVYVAGNHEFYDLDRPETLARLRASAQANQVHLLDNDAVVISTKSGEHVRFLGCTLWTDFLFFGDDMKAAAMDEGQAYLNDFRLIWEGWERFTPARSIELYEESLAWLKVELAKSFDGKTVVVTHHLPSAQSVSERFKDSLLTACFASNLDDLFGQMALWVHGHTHDCMDYEANSTRVVCNPRRYPLRCISIRMRKLVHPLFRGSAAPTCSMSHPS